MYRKIFAGNSNDQTSEAQNAKVRDVRENSIETVSDNLKSEEQLSAAKVASGGEDNEGAALVTEAGIKGGGTGSPTFPASALPSARQETAGIPVEALDPVLKYFDARIASAGPQQPEVNTAPAPAPGGPYEASAAQAQNLASPVKGAEKQAEGPRGTLSSWRLAQDTAEQAEAARIKTAAAESPSSDRSFDGNPNRAVELAQNAGEQPTGGVARHLVLEMEPDELGKISIKVGAKKGEISVEALTQNEPARQALMRHSPGLRQDLQDQGLVLEKFMVDVNREKSGGGNYPGENNPKEKTPPVSKTAKTVSIQAAAESAHIRETDGQSRISIFA